MEHDIPETRGTHVLPVPRASCVFNNSRTTRKHPFQKVCTPAAEKLGNISIPQGSQRGSFSNIHLLLWYGMFIEHIQ
jgi:hypothetical protein